MRSTLLVSFLFSTLIACGDNPIPSSADGGKPLTSTEAEPAGAHCAAGGVAVHAGIDTNGNGVLDASEITSTTYTCSHQTLLRQDAIGSGPVCPGGGVEVRTGHDTNDDGSLEDSEIEDTTTVCYSDELFTGNLKTSDFATADAQQKLSHVRVVTGNLTIDSAAAMPSLTVVGGNLDLRVESLVELPALGQVIGSLIGPPIAIVAGDQNPPRGVMLDAPVLREVGGNVQMTSWVEGGVFSAPSLTGVDGFLDFGGKLARLDLGKLNRVGRSLDMEPTEPIAISLPALTQIGQGIRLGGQATALDLRALATTDFIQIMHSNLSTLALPALSSISRILILNSASLKSLAMPALASAPSLSLVNLPALSSIDLGDASALESLSVAKLPITDLAILSSLRSIKTLVLSANPNLVDLGGLDQLTTVTDLTISSNPALTSLSGLDALVKMDGNLVIQGNAALASLAGLAALTNVTGQITIANNAALPASELAAFLTRLGR